jgi:uncharacterized repeat protein (TIGR03803 family)
MSKILQQSLLQIKISRSINKICYLIIVLMFITYSVDAQKFYGVIDGNYVGSGSIFSINADRSDFKKIRLPGMESLVYKDPMFGRLVKHSNGKVYGIGVAGGNFGYGYVFELDPNSGTINVMLDTYAYMNRDHGSDLIEYKGKLLHNSSFYLISKIEYYDPLKNEFEDVVKIPNGSSDLTLVGDKLYGFTQNGGGGWAGSIYEVDLITKSYSFLQAFEYSTTRTGRAPMGRPILYNGKLYGVTTGAGEFGGGTLFEYDITLKQFKKLYDFSKDQIGRKPIVDLEIVGNKLIGRTSEGGAYNKGTTFSYDISTNTFNKLNDLTTNTGSQALRKFNGVLYGFSSEGDGSIYTLNPDTGEVSILFQFSSENNRGYKPMGIVSIDSDNVVWGATQYGGSKNGGVIFSYNLTTSEYKEYFSFNDFPVGKRLNGIEFYDNLFYGITTQGGANNAGAIFSYDTLTHAITLKHDLPSLTNNAYDPSIMFELSKDEDLLYGFLNESIFEYAISLEEFRTAYTFPTGIHVKDVALLGDHYIGLTSSGGNHNEGIFFSLTRSNNSFEIVTHLPQGSRGKIKAVESYEGNFYVVSETDSAYNLNLYTSSTKTFTILASLPTYDEEQTYINFELLKSGGGKLVLKTMKYKPYPYFNVYESYTYSISTNDFTKISGVIDTNSFLDENGFYYPFGFYDYQAESGTTYFDREYNDLMEEIIDLHVFPGNSLCDFPTMLSLIDYSQGKRKDGKRVDANRSNPIQGLEVTYDDTFFSLGFGGYITLMFDKPLCDVAGNDFTVVETSHGNPVFANYPEQAEILVSQDGETWYLIGITNPENPSVDCLKRMNTSFDFSSSGLPWIQYIQVRDVTNPLAKRRNKTDCSETIEYAFNSAADGFDLNGIQLVMNVSFKNEIPKNNVTVEVDSRLNTARVFPNPMVEDHLTINLDEEVEMVLVDDFVTLEIVDMMGKVWSSEKITVGGDWKIEKHVPSLRSGMYIARITSGNVNRYYKFLKN